MMARLRRLLEVLAAMALMTFVLADVPPAAADTFSGASLSH